MKAFLTGAGGFVGSHVLRHLLMETDWEIVCSVSFQHKGMPERIASSTCGDDKWARRVTIVHWDMQAPAPMSLHAALEGCEVFMNVASESHVDRSIEDPVGFTLNNTALMLNVLELARRHKPKIFLQMSTDEVYGPAYGDHRHKEWETLAPSNPYSASKAAQEAICFSYWRTYGVPVVITNTMNIVGEMQDPEKFVPMTMSKIMRSVPVIVHCAPDGTPGSRFYLHARNLADAWLYLARQVLDEKVDMVPYAGGARRPPRFHIVGDREVNNLDLVGMIYEWMCLAGLQARRPPEIKMESFHSSRPGHDLRYALDGSKIADLGWRAPVSLDDSMAKTVAWTLAHPEWLASA